MTETTAKSGRSGPSTTPADQETRTDGAAPAGRDAAGRAAVSADAGSPPKFTRAPGMPPPPGEPAADKDGSSEPKRPAGPAVAKGSATVPIVTKGKGGSPSSAPGRPGVMPQGKPGAAPQRPGNAPAGGGKRPGGMAGSAAGRAPR